LSEPAFDQLLRRLADADVDFVVVGGLALNAWGVIRGTKDVDVVVSPEIENLRQVAAIAVEANGHVQQGEALLGSQLSIAAALADGAQVAIGCRPSRSSDREPPKPKFSAPTFGFAPLMT
jgi:hypothetical protein